MVGRVIDGRYRIDALLGEGGMGQVYRGVHVSLQRPVAIKVLPPFNSLDPQVIRRFLREARVASRLRNAHTVSTFDFGRTGDGILFLVMELLEGVPLRVVLQQAGRIEPGRACRIAAQILESLVEAHAQHILHRDIKPENVMLLGCGGPDEFVKVFDFGIARALARGNTITDRGIVFGTPCYMSPEQARGDVLDPRSDLYSVGILLFEMIAGRMPVEEARPVRLLDARRDPRAPVLSSVAPDANVPPALDGLVASLLEFDPRRRPASAEAVLEELRGGEPALVPSGPTGAGASPRVTPRWRRGLPFWLALATGLLGLAAGLAIRALLGP